MLWLQHKSPSNLPAFRRKILNMHFVIYTQLPKFFFFVREKDFDLSPQEGILMTYTKRGANGDLSASAREMLYRSWENGIKMARL